MGGWRAAPTQQTVTVWGMHPVQVAREESIDRLYALNLSGATNMRRDQSQSAFNGTRFSGDLGPLQSFLRVYGFQPAGIRMQPKSLPTAEGASAGGSSLLGSIGATVG